MSSQIISYTDFRKGLNDTASPDNLEDNELSVAMNITLSTRGGFSTRKGTQKFTGDPVAEQVGFDAACTQILSWPIKSQEIMLAIVSKNLCYVEDGNLITIQALAADRIGTFSIQNKLYYGDGTTLRILTMGKSLADGTATSGTDNTLTHTTKTWTVNEWEGYTLKITDGTGEGQSRTITSNTADTLTVETNWATNPDVTSVYSIFDENGIATEEVTATGGDVHAKFRLIVTMHCQKAGDIEVVLGSESKTFALTLDESRTSVATKIAAATWTDWTVTREGYEITFESTIAGDRKLYYDPRLTGAWADIMVEQRGISADNVFEQFEKCIMFELHVASMRIFGSGNPDDPTAVYYSEPLDPTYIKSTSIMYPASSEGQVTAMIHFMRSMMVSYNHSWWQFSGTDPEGEAGAPDATWVKMPIPYGCVSNYSVALTPQSFTFLSKEGLHSVSNQLLSEMFIAVDSRDLVRNLTADKVTGVMDSIKNREKAELIYHDSRVYLSYADNTSLDHNNKMLVFDWRNDGFVQYEGWVCRNMVRHTGGLYIASDNYILKAETGYVDIDVITGEEKPIIVHAETKNYNLGSDVMTKFLRFFHIRLRQYLEEESNCDVSIITDYEEETFLDFSLVDSLIYDRVWELTWGWVDYIQKQMEIFRYGERFRVKVYSERLNDPLTMYGFGFHFKRLKAKSDRLVKRGLLE